MCLSRKAVHKWVKKRGRRFADDEEVETEMRKWLRQQSKDFYAAGLDALETRWDKCINVGGEYVEKYFFRVRISHVLRFISICDLFTDSPLYLVYKIARKYVINNLNIIQNQPFIFSE
jgi:hypothetical protein